MIREVTTIPVAVDSLVEMSVETRRQGKKVA